MPSNDPERDIRKVLKNEAKPRLENAGGEVFSRTEVIRAFMNRVSFWSDRHVANMHRDHLTDDMSRRRFLKLLGFGLGGAALAASGAGSVMGQRIFDADGAKTPTGYASIDPSQDSATLHGWDYDVVDATEYIDVGDAVDHAIKAMEDDIGLDGNLLVFPEGDYAVTTDHAYGSGNDLFYLIKDHQNFGIYGNGRVQITPDGYFNSHMFNIRESERVVVQNLVLDQRADDVVTGVVMGNSGDYHVENIIAQGHGRGPESTADQAGWEANFIPTTVRAGSNGTIKNCVDIVDGFNYDNHTEDEVPRARMGVWTGSGAEGDLDIVDCTMEGYPNNALYCSNIEGSVRVLGGLYRNNNVASVRLGTSTSIADDVLIENDVSKSESPSPYGDEASLAFAPQHKPHLEEPGGPTHQNCRVKLRDIEGHGAFIGLSGGMQEPTVFRNVIFDVDAPESHVLIGRTAGGTTVILENCHITGQAADNGDAALQMNDVPIEIRNCCIDWSGGPVVTGSNIGEQDYTEGNCDDVGTFPPRGQTRTGYAGDPGGGGSTGGGGNTGAGTGTSGTVSGRERQLSPVYCGDYRAE